MARTTFRYSQYCTAVADLLSSFIWQTRNHVQYK